MLVWLVMGNAPSSWRAQKGKTFSCDANSALFCSRYRVALFKFSSTWFSPSCVGFAASVRFTVKGRPFLIAIEDPQVTYDLHISKFVFPDGTSWEVICLDDYCLYRRLFLWFNLELFSMDWLTTPKPGEVGITLCLHYSLFSLIVSAFGSNKELS